MRMDRCVLTALAVGLLAGGMTWGGVPEVPPVDTRPPASRPGPREWRPAVGPGPRPVVLFTDFGPESSNEDWLDVATALLEPSIDLRAVVLEVVTDNDTRPAASLRDLCLDFGDTRAAIFTGSTPRQLVATRFWPGWKDGVAALAAFLERMPKDERVTFVATGRLTNLAELLRRRPDLVHERVDRIYVAASYLFSRNLEFHIEQDPDAWVATMRSGAPIVLAPRDVAGAPVDRRAAPAAVRRLMALKGDDSRPQWTSSMPVWMLAAKRHDAAAWGAALKVQPAHFSVAYPGQTVDCDVEAEKPNIAVVTEADRQAMLDFLTQALSRTTTTRPAQTLPVIPASQPRPAG
jgi:hypothetical protein